MKFAEMQKARTLRSEGLSLKEIKELVPASKSTLSLWLRDIHLTGEQIRNLKTKQERARQMVGEMKKAERHKRAKEAHEKGKREFASLLKNPLFLCGLSLYWAEGDKHRQERVKFTNSDPLMIKIMMRWFREICKVPEAKFRIALHIHDIKMAEDPKSFWSKLTGVRKSQFQKIWVKPSSLRQRRNVLYNGTCGIVVNDRALFRRIGGWKEACHNYFNISP